MAVFRARLLVGMILLFLAVASPVSVLGGRAGLVQEDDVTGLASEILLRRSDESSVGRLRSRGHIGLGFSGRKMLAAGRPVEASEPGNEPPPTSEQLGEHASVDAVPSAATQSTTAPAPPRFASRFAFFFRSLAKGSPTPSTGTPSPGHN